MSRLRQRLEQLDRSVGSAPGPAPELRRRLDRIFRPGRASTEDTLTPVPAPPHPVNDSTPSADLIRQLGAERVAVGDSSALQVV